MRGLPWHGNILDERLGDMLDERLGDMLGGEGRGNQ